jgi:hypothetical protein
MPHRERSSFLNEVTPTCSTLPAEWTSLFGTIIDEKPIKEVNDNYFKRNPQYHPSNDNLWGLSQQLPPFDEKMGPSSRSGFEKWMAVVLM